MLSSGIHGIHGVDSGYRRDNAGTRSRDARNGLRALQTIFGFLANQLITFFLVFLLGHVPVRGIKPRNLSCIGIGSRVTRNRQHATYGHRCHPSKPTHLTNCIHTCPPNFFAISRD
jgi:hypothetical protein